jgi:hypothetical protein
MFPVESRRNEVFDMLATVSGYGVPAGDIRDRAQQAPLKRNMGTLRCVVRYVEGLMPGGYIRL